MAKQQHVEMSGPMAGHVRRGRLFVPEFAATVDLRPNDWFRDDLPDYLWPLMIAESQGNSSLIRFVRWQGAVQADLRDLVPAKDLAAGLDGRLTSLDRLAALNDTAADVTRERAIEYYLLTDQIAKALSTYPERPAAWLTDRELTGPDQDDADLIAASLLGVLGDGHREALVKCFQIWSGVQAGTFSSDRHMIDLLKKYPNDVATRSQADTVVRASWGAMKGLLLHEDEKYFDSAIKWARVFWGVNSMTTACRRKREVDDEAGAGVDEESEATPAEKEVAGERPAGQAATRVEDVDPDGEHDFRQTAMDLMSSYVEAIETSPQRLYDPERQEVHAGLVSRAAREVITALGAPDLWCLEHGAHVAGCSWRPGSSWHGWPRRIRVSTALTRSTAPAKRNCTHGSLKTCPKAGTARTKPSVSVGVAGLGLAGQDGAGRVGLGVTLEAIDPQLRCLSVELSIRGGAAGTVRPTSVT